MASASTQSLRERVPAFVVWVLVFAAGWWIVTESSAGSWWIGLPTAGVAAMTAVALVGSPPRLRGSAILGFLWFVLARSAAGSVDVALRSLRPRLAIAPEVLEHRLRADRGAVLLATLVSLLPGTLAARLEGRQLVVHSLADPTAAEKEIAALEEHIARLLGENEQGLPR